MKAQPLFFPLTGADQIGFVAQVEPIAVWN
jgi:hypothetical protein